MIFNSINFLIFYLVVTTLFYVLPPRLRTWLLVLASSYFYACFIPSYLLILIGIILLDYGTALAIENATDRRRRMLLLVSLSANIGLLAVFKYSNFIAENIELLLRHAVTVPRWRYALPLGLSFHTFQAMSYTIEVYRGRQRPERNLVKYALYVLFYPQLVAGPIERPQNLLPQFDLKSKFDWDNLFSGLKLVAVGFFKKIVIADRLALYVNAVWEKPDSYHAGNLLLAAIFYSIQIYCDFSGYSDIARGTARTMGVTLMRNFASPYLATNIRDFWARWHISLSTWFRDYLYFPLGGSQGARLTHARNLLLVFLVSGLWHGASWNFVFWGALHAAFMLIYVFGIDRLQGAVFQTRLWKLGSVIGTYSLVTLAWVPFRAPNWVQCRNMLENMFAFRRPEPFAWVMRSSSGSQFGTVSAVIAAAAVLALIALERAPLEPAYERPVPAWLDIGMTSGLAVGTILFGAFVKVSFIYFQF